MVVIEANHLCMAMRGVKQRTSETITSEIRWDKEKFTLDQMEKIKEEAQLHLYR
jgi:GTP cyclohydrolase I